MLSDFVYLPGLVFKTELLTTLSAFGLLNS